ncbi:MAG TPA: ATP-binding protein [Nocardioidaceae bacterium]|nr:ATP-binding protein [Nocardioidaceae bacterium]
MDWILDSRRDDAKKAAVKAVEDHLRRHTSNESSVPTAVEVADSAIRSEAEDAGDSPLWLHLDWSRVLPNLTIRAVPRDAAPVLEAGFDAVSATRRDSLAHAALSEPTSIDLTVPKEVTLNYDPDVAVLVDLDPVNDGPAAAAVALAAAAESHPVAGPDQVAAAAGAILADASMRQDDVVESTKDAVDLFGRLHEALGGTYQRVRVDDDGFELEIDRSPFGAAIRQLPSMARVTEAIAGRISARLHGKATVIQDETIGLGDRTDRLRVRFGDVEDEICGSTYQWPPAGVHAQSDPSPRLEMTVSLPRQSHSVPVIRRLAAQILRAFGVAADSIHDVELAISEACANVIQHAIDSEGYEVSIELAADRCAITVLDRGDGFDATLVSDQKDDDAESGRGLTLMRALVDNLNFVSEPKIGAVVHMVKRLDYDSTHPFRRTGTE